MNTLAPQPGSNEHHTVLERLIEQLRARAVPLDGQVPPAAILWTDPHAEWRGLMELLRTRVGELLVLGDYAPEARTGPAIWIRCVVDGALDIPGLPKGSVPVVYLPGVGRQQLRAGEECADHLKPLVELMYRGALWHQPNGKDWTVMAFLTSSRTLGLDIAQDRATHDALLRALPEVALTPLAQLGDRQLQADDFDRMLAGDVIRDILRWMGDPHGTRARLGENGWEAFRNRCRDELDFDPDREADVVAGERLGRGEGSWAAVWERFAEAPSSYGDIAELLRRSRPVDEMFLDRSRWPDLNEQDETWVRNALSELPQRSHHEACNEILELESRHGERRGWVWARLGLSPMAEVLEPLARLARAVSSGLGGHAPDEMAETYVQRGWQADAASWEALASIPTADEALVAPVIRHLLQPWLEDSAQTFQALVARQPLPGSGALSLVEAGEDVCLLFADGLRFDLGQRLAERMEARGLRASLGHRWAALPTVTATAKPAVTPVAHQITGKQLGEQFEPSFADQNKPANAVNLRSAMKAKGYQVIADGTLDSPRAHPARGWLEAGDVDPLGHKLGTRLARQIPEELDRLAERIQHLLDAGWRAVRVVTDHGWLLLPGGLPKVGLPRHLTESRWARCAVIAGESTPDVPRLPWFWNSSQWFAAAPGIACFNKSEEYAHGGVSIEECLIPDLLIEQGDKTRVAAKILSITWRGLRCFVEASVSGGAVTADLRLEQPSGQSVTAQPKPIEPDGAASLVLVDDEFEGRALVLVLCDETGRILAQKPTSAGIDS
ncbi:MAG TPA: BREX-1 system phosphatase PglZ type B [Gammaproteobacteria bacterium]|nr:BREX-1 system phosphatase PglZ type B [Gammaproteobacteria bacterium]